MKSIAIIGGGISGLSAAYYLKDQYKITLIESCSKLGGHTATKTFQVDGETLAIDTGFIVFNDRTYPNFERLLDELDVASQNTEMGFSVSCDKTGLEYSGGSLATLFAQKKNIFRWKHWKMIFDIVSFNRKAKQWLEDYDNAETIDESMSLGEFLSRLGLSKRFENKYLLPMGAAIWSSSTKEILNFPAQSFIRFFLNHGLLDINHRPQWKVILGGSHQYVSCISECLANNKNVKVHLNAKAKSVRSNLDKVEVHFNDSRIQFDEVIFACHSDQASQLLSNEFSYQKEVLNKISYQSNDVVLHTDDTMLPKCQSTWSSWNYRIKEKDTVLPTLTYNMNILQGFDCATTLCVTLNDTASIDPSKILGEYCYTHPVYNRNTLQGQNERALINGKDHLWFCGAYWYSGFHEDGLRSALDVVNRLGVDIEIL